MDSMSNMPAGRHYARSATGYPVSVDLGCWRSLSRRGLRGSLQVVGNETLAELVDVAGLRQVPGAKFRLELSLGQVVVAVGGLLAHRVRSDWNVAVTDSACSRRACPTESAF